MNDEIIKIIDELSKVFASSKKDNDTILRAINILQKPPKQEDTEILDILPCGCKQTKRWVICGDCYEKATKE